MITHVAFRLVSSTVGCMIISFCDMIIVNVRRLAGLMTIQTDGMARMIKGIHGISIAYGMWSHTIGICSITTTKEKFG